MTIIAGSDNLSSYITPGVTRMFCKTCGTHVVASANRPEVKVAGPIYVSSNIFPAMPFKPTFHVHCGSCSDTALLAVLKDGLPKYKDLPKESGGSGRLWSRWQRLRKASFDVGSTTVSQSVVKLSITQLGIGFVRGGYLQPS